MESHGRASGGRVTIAVPVALVSLLAGCVGGCRSPVPFRGRPGPGAPVPALGAPVPYVRPTHAPPLLDQRGGLPDAPADVYAFTQAGMLGPVARTLPLRVYVPGARGIDVIDPASYQVVRRIPLAHRPRQVVPSWDLRTLWVTEPGGLVPVDAKTGEKGRTVRVAAAMSDLYFSLDGREAIALDSRHGRVEIRDPDTMRLRGALRVPCSGLGHADFSAAGDTLAVGCTTGRLALVDLTRRRPTRTLRLADGSHPRDIRLSPDGTTFYVADDDHGGVWLVDALRFRRTGFIHTGHGARGLYPSRDSTTLYVTNGGERTVSLISFARRRQVRRWRVPAAPDMAAVSPTGRVLWLSSRTGTAVYAISTASGRVLREVAAGPGTRGVCVHPQPGRFSLGHSGNYR
jgi:DNA-binding beta-propeller fold protein YncE